MVICDKGEDVNCIFLKVSFRGCLYEKAGTPIGEMNSIPGTRTGSPRLDLAISFVSLENSRLYGNPGQPG